MIYLDNAATTALGEEVLAVMQPYFGSPGNPSSLHALGRRAKAAVERAREQVAELIGAVASEVVFTSGGTESIHTALFGAWLARGERNHIVSSKVEHHAVLHTLEFLQTLGVKVTLVSPDGNGVVPVESVLEQIRPDTFCVSIMAVNNETGAISPTEEIARRVKALDESIVVHSDMVQAPSGMEVDLHSSLIDLASFSAHKLHGPQGVGALYVKRGCAWRPVLHGGAQERKRRAGTENVAGIVGFGAAANHMKLNLSSHLRHLQTLRHTFLEGLKVLEGVHIHGTEHGSPGIVNVAFTGVPNDTLLMRLDLLGIAASVGSACTAGSPEPSHVLFAMGLSAEEVRSSLRFSFSHGNTVEEVKHAASVVVELIESFQRKMRSR